MADANNDKASETAGTTAAAQANAAGKEAGAAKADTSTNVKSSASTKAETASAAQKAAAKDSSASSAHDAGDASTTAQDADSDLSEDVKSTVDALLDEKALSSKKAPTKVRNLMSREKDNNRRVQDTIKNAKTNPKWFVPLFVTLLLVGLAWVIVYYATSQQGPGWPIPAIGNWNLLIGFLIMLAGFIMTMWWN